MSGQPDFALGELMSAWASGPALASAPSRWAEALAPGGVEAELRLIALAGHALEVGFRPLPSGPLTESRPLPALGLPFLTEAHRLRFRRLLKDMSYGGDRHQLLRFLAARGRVAHPLDWTPGPNDDEIPAVYAPWRDWAAGHAPPPEEALSAANWEDWTRAGRRTAFADLRRAESAAALALLEAKFPTLKAEDRLDLADLLRQGLSEADRAFLTGIQAKDRAPNVKQLATALLARLDMRAEATPEAAAAQLFEEFVKTERKGILKRALTLSFKKKREEAARERFIALIEAAGLEALAAKAGGSRLELVKAWPHDDHLYGQFFRPLLLEQGRPEEIKAFLAEIFGMDQRQTSTHLVPEMMERLTEAEQFELLPVLFQRGQLSFDEHLSNLGLWIGRAPMALVRESRLWRQSVAMLDAELKGQGPLTQLPPHLLPEHLRILGGMFDQAGAREALDDFARMGLSPADPRLDLLTLNADLNADFLEAHP